VSVCDEAPNVCITAGGVAAIVVGEIRLRVCDGSKAMLLRPLATPVLALFAAHGLVLGTTVVFAIAGHGFADELRDLEAVDTPAESTALGHVPGDVGLPFAGCEVERCGGGGDVGPLRSPGEFVSLGRGLAVLDTFGKVLTIIPFNCDSLFIANLHPHPIIAGSVYHFGEDTGYD